MRLRADDVRARARGAWCSAIFPRLAPELGAALARPGRHVPSPKRGGSDGFRLFADAAETGGGIDNQAGAFPDGFALLGWLRGWTFPETLRAVADVLGMGPGEAPRVQPPAPLPPRRPPQENAKARALCRALWAERQPDGAGLEYLRARVPSWTGPLPPDLAAHPAAAFVHEGRELGRFPCLLGLLRRGDGQPVGLHRTFLDPREPRKARVLDPHTGAPLSPKRLTPAVWPGAAAGAVVRLGEPTEGLLALAEGIEAAAAIQAATGAPTWAAWCAGSMARAEIPETVRRLELWPDLDPVGRKAAEDLGARLASRGVTVRIFSACEVLP